MFEVCVASWRCVLFVICCVSVAVCRVGFGVVMFYCISVFVVVACYSLCVDRCVGACCLLLDGGCLLVVWCPTLFVRCFRLFVMRCWLFVV